MTLREILAAQGIPEEQIAKIEAAMKENKVYTASEENLDIRYGKLKGQHDDLTKQHEEAKALIEQLKKAGAGDSETQKKIADYEAKIQQLESEMRQTALDNAIRFELLAAKAKPEDVDYLMFRIKRDNENLKVTEDGKVKGLDAIVTTLKTSCAANFETAAGGKADPPPKVDPLPLPKPDPGAPKLTRAELLRNPRKANELYNKDPEAYKQIMHGAETKEGEG